MRIGTPSPELGPSALVSCDISWWVQGQPRWSSATLIVLFLGCNNPLAFLQHDETFRYAHYSSMVWPWMGWVTPFGNQQEDSLVTKGVTQHILPLIAKLMGPSWGRQDPGGPHVGHMNLAIWDVTYISHCNCKMNSNGHRSVRQLVDFFVADGSVFPRW